MDPITMAGAVVTTLSPYLIEAAKGAGGKIGEAAYESGPKLFKFLKDKLRGQDEQKALSRLAQTPEDQDNQAALRVVLKEALQRDGTLLSELEPLLKAIPQTASTQSMHIVGDDNVSTQAAGQGISISVGERK
jgi:hypothetical protein